MSLQIIETAFKSVCVLSVWDGATEKPFIDVALENPGKQMQASVRFPSISPACGAATCLGMHTPSGSFISTLGKTQSQHVLEAHAVSGLVLSLY